ncbi:hypothetical protein Tco_1005375 [Tanacetum coccineum]|uniref:Uncharacterized protein n=1 Tax=Tanacetum coccineum TaxID=301880 RepID=A0ABQ5FGF9_9ASTR
MPRGTTQVVTRGASNHCMQRWRLDQSACDTWHWRVSVRGTVAVSTRSKEAFTGLYKPIVLGNFRGMDKSKITRKQSKVSKHGHENQKSSKRSQRSKSLSQSSSSRAILAISKSPHCFNAESYLIESLLNRDSLIDSSSKFDYLLEELSGKLAHTDPIPPEVVDTDSEPEEEICLAENLSYYNSSPRHSPKNVILKIADTIVRVSLIHLLSSLSTVTHITEEDRLIS